MSKAELFTAGVKVVFEELAKRADAGDEASLMFLHNTSADKLQRVQDMGGMPMPSIAITDKDIPFENFGDITLVGKPESFDPKSSSLNQAFSADAYTVRAPRPVRIAKKGAGKRFQELYGADAKELDVYADDTAANVWDLEKKGDVREDKYDQVVRWFDRWSGPIFLKRKGIEFNKDDGLDINEKLRPFKQSGEFKQWAEESVDDLFEEGEYFVANPNRDYYTQKAKLTPYTADEIAKVMKRSAGRGGEGGMSVGSPGSVRAAYSEKLTSLDAMRKRKDQLSGDIGIEKDEIANLLIDLGEAIKPYYKYDPNGWSYQEAVSELMTEGATRGLKRSADFVGFENIPQDLMSELEGFQQILKKAPTEYFESKPKRVVQLNEFGGAIVPEDTSQATIDLLTRQGLEIERYTDDAQRLAARNKFQDMLFQLPPVAATAVISGIAAVAAPDAQAGPITVGRNVAAELAKRAAAGDTVAAEGIRAYHGSPHDFDEFSTSQIGTGEGAQAYGRGLYFAEREGTAQSYRDQLGPKAAITDAIQSGSFDDARWRAATAVLQQGSEDNALAVLRGNVERGHARSQEVIDAIMDKSYQEIDLPKGSMYEVNIAATPDEFIDWDLPLDEQSESVMNALKKTDWYQYAEEGAINAADQRGDNAYGMDLVRYLEEDGAEDAAQMLKDAGIKGVQYADAQTRFGKGPKTKNYVVYDDRLVDITRKYGISIPLATAVLAGSMTPEEAQAGPISATKNARTWFHGSSVSDKPIRDFDPSMLGSSSGAKDASEGFYFGGRRSTAEAYLEDGDILPPEYVDEYDRLAKPAQDLENSLRNDYPVPEGATDKEKLAVMGRRIEDPRYDEARKLRKPANKFIMENSKPGKYGSITEAQLDMKDPFIVDFQGEPWDEARQMSVIKEAKAQGHDGVIFQNMQDSGWFGGSGADDIALVFDPKSIKTINAISNKYGVGPVAAAAIAAGSVTPEEAQSSQAGMGGMGVQSAPVTQDEEAIIAAQQPAPTGADLMQQANDDFLSGIVNQPGSFFNPETYDVIGDTARGAFDATTGFLGDMEQMLVGGIMQGIGGATTWEDALKMIGGGLGQEIINAPEGRFGRFEEGIKNYDPAFITSGEVGQVPGMIPSFGTQDEERTKRAKMLGGFFSPI